jgi:hypothetical protein
VDRALWLLLYLGAVARLRRWGRNLRTAKGALLTLVGLLAFVPWLASVALSASQAGPARVESSRRLGPPLLLANCLLTLLFAKRGQGIPFTPPEVQFLFSGPFSRRQLLAYRVASNVASALLGAGFFALLLRQNAARGLAAYVGTALTLVFMQLFAMTVTLALGLLDEVADTWRRRLVLAGMAGLLAAVVLSLGGDLARLPAGELLRRVERSPVTTAVLTPFGWFVGAFTAERLWPDLAASASLALAVDVALLVAMFALDAQYLEASATASARLYERMERMRRGVAVAPRRGAPSRSPAASRAVAWCGGVGPIAWRQWATALAGRSWGTAIAYGTVAAGAGLALWCLTPRDLAWELAIATQSVVLGLGLVLSFGLRLDFRGDFERIELLKTLPIAPGRLALGQLVVPVLLLSGFHWAALAVIGLGTRTVTPLTWPAAALAPPVGMLLLAIDNLFFLWFPIRLPSAPAGDLATLGRVILLSGAKVMAIALAGGAAALLGLGAYAVTGRSLLAALVAAWLVLAGASASLVPAIALAFEHFDVARDTPS